MAAPRPPQARQQGERPGSMAGASPERCGEARSGARSGVKGAEGEQSGAVPVRSRAPASARSSEHRSPPRCSGPRSRLRCPGSDPDAGAGPAPVPGPDTAPQLRAAPLQPPRPCAERKGRAGPPRRARSRAVLRRARPAGGPHLPRHCARPGPARLGFVTAAALRGAPSPSSARLGFATAAALRGARSPSSARPGPGLSPLPP